MALLLGLLGESSLAWAASTPGAPADAAPATATAEANTAEVSFDRSLLSGGGSNTDTLARFEQGPVVLPGNYSIDLYVNNIDMGRASVRFAAHDDSKVATPCITHALLEQMRLKPELSDAAQARLADAGDCVGIGDLIDDASTDFDMGELRLDVSVPQASMGQQPRGYVAPENLDEGVTAGLLNYRFNSYHTSSHGHGQTSSYLNLDAGLNLGRWHLRHKSALNWRSANAGQSARHHWQNIETYARRDLTSLRAQLTVGDAYTSGDLFDSIALRGVQIATDQRMLPDSQRGYAPVVRGVAQSNAKVVIRQNGVQLYQTTVAPGPFVINDLYPTGYGGDLQVSVTEADGHTHSFTVPYASIAQLLRPDTTRFSLALGKARNPSLSHEQLVTQGTLQHGFNNLLTAYTGVVGARGYFAWLLGGALNTHWGAMAMDITSARTKIPGQATLKGRSLRLTYSKILPVTNTSLTVAAYRYSTRGYLGLNDALQARDYARRNLPVFATGPHAGSFNQGNPQIPGLPGGIQDDTFAPRYTGGIDRSRNRFSITLNQRLGDRAGALFANASTRDYWNRPQRDTQFQIGYNNHYRALGYSLSATRTRDPFGHSENQFFASFNISLGSGTHAPSLSANFGRDSQGNWQEQATLNGSAGRDNQFNYGATVSHDGAGAGNAVSLNGGYRSPYAVFNASAGKGSGYNQTSLGMSGAVVAHPGGITFGQPMGDTVGIVVAKHAGGARVANAAGARIDRFGYALVPYLTPYNRNTVSLDPKGLPLDVQLDSTSTQVAPHAGAVVMIRFKTDYGRSMIVHAQLADGSPMPFGAQVSDASGAALGVVGQGGQVLIRGIKQSGRLLVHWTDDAGAARSCGFDYNAPGKKNKQAFTSMSAVCKPQAQTHQTHGGQS